MDSADEDAGEGTSTAPPTSTTPQDLGISMPQSDDPPDYTSPSDDEEELTVGTPRASFQSETRPLLDNDPPIPTYEAAIGDVEAAEARDHSDRDERP